MAVPYDTYDYPSYWKGRDYEHQSEFAAIKYLLAKIPTIRKVLEVGAGFGRLVPAYFYRAKKVVLTDSSAGVLRLARQKLKDETRVEFQQISLENIASKFRPHSFDLVVLIRVLHHVQDTPQAFKIISSLTTDRGYFILEFPNKYHLKARWQQLLKGNFDFATDLQPLDIRCAKSVKKKTLPFFNYHPRYIENQLRQNGFKIIEKLSVSNMRSSFLKKYFATETLLTWEKWLQKPLSFLDFGPSIFVLAQKQAQT